MKKTAIIFSCILMALFLIQFSSALYPCDWTTYGGDLTYMPNSQYYWDCKSHFETAGVTSQTYPSGMSSVPYQPLVAGVGTFEEPRVVLQSGNYLQVLDENMDLVTEFFTGALVGQMDIGNFYGEGKFNGIIGIYRINSTMLSYNVFKFDEETDNLTLTTYFNFSYGTNAGSNGVRCLSGNTIEETECYTILYSGTTGSYSNNIFRFNATAGYSEHYINTTYFPIIEPISWADWDDDGDIEYLFWSADKWFIYDFENGVIEREQNEKVAPPHDNVRISGAKFFFPLATQNLNWFKKLIYPNANKGRIVISKHCEMGTWACSSSSGGCGFHSEELTAYKPDFSVMWNNCYGSTGSGDKMYSQGIAIADYNGDDKEDVWMAIKRGGTGVNDREFYHVLKGDDGTELYNYQRDSSFLGNVYYPNSQTTLVRLNYDSIPEFLITSGNMAIFDTTTNSFIFNDTYGGWSACIPADLNFDGLQDIICSASGNTEVFYVNYTNENSYIDIIAFDPSSTIVVNTTLYAMVSATDPETDQIFYSIKCGNLADWTNFTTSDTQSCYFTNVGVYNVSLRVKDVFHSEYDHLSGEIIVTQTGTICDNDDVCEASQGETYQTCPNDCPFSEEEPSSQVEGGTSIPTKLVDTENYESGLLPSIYYGTLGFFSNILSPLFIIVVLFLSVAIIIMIIAIAIKLVKKAGNL